MSDRYSNPKDYPSPLKICAFIVLLVSSVTAHAGAGAGNDNYYPESIAFLAESNPCSPLRWHSHVEITGLVEYIHKEKDGDIHIRLSDGSIHRIIAECIPETPQICNTLKIKKGQALKVRGLTYYDWKHGWWEIHPITGWSIVK